MRFAFGLMRILPLCAFIALTLFFPRLSAGQDYYLLGDNNGDGWCNWVDCFAFDVYLHGGPYFVCPEGADVNGSGDINSVDLILLSEFLNGSGIPPVGACPFPTMAYDPSRTAEIGFLPIPDGDPGTATFRVYFRTSEAISCALLPYRFDPGCIVGFAADSRYPNTGVNFGFIRPLDPPNNVVPISFTAFYNRQGQSFPYLTHIFNLIITAIPGAPDTSISLADDPIFGSPACYLGTTERMHLVPSPNIAGDANGDAIVNGLDVTYLVNYLKTNQRPPMGRYLNTIPIDWDY